MPTYEYHCGACAQIFERRLPMAVSAAAQKCPVCARPAGRILSRVAAIKSIAVDSRSTSTGYLPARRGVNIHNLTIVGADRGVVAEGAASIAGDVTTENCRVGVSASSSARVDLRHTSRFDQVAREIRKEKKE